MKTFFKSLGLILVLTTSAIAAPINQGPVYIYQPLGGSSGGGGGSGCIPTGSAGNILTDSGSGTCGSDNSATLSSGSLTLGSSGVLGQITFGNATSGTINLQPVTGALGTINLKLPAFSDTLIGKATTDILTNKSISGSTNTLTNIGNSSLTNSATTVNGQTCTLGSTCTVTAAATGITIESTAISSGTVNGLLYDHAGVIGNLASANSGVLVTSGSGVPSISATLPNGIALGAATATSINKITITPPATGATLTIADGKTLTDTSGIGAKLLLGTTGGGFTGYAGGTCTNQFLTAISNSGVLTCGSVLDADLSLTTPSLGTPSSLTLTHATGLPVAGITGLGIGVGTWLGTPSSANLAAAVTDETGSGALVFANTPTLVTPNIGAATGTSLAVSGAGNSNVTAISEATGVNNIGIGLVSKRSTNDSQLYIGYRTTPAAFVIAATYSSTGTYAPIILATHDTAQLEIPTTGGLQPLGSAPTVTGTGTPSIASGSTDTAGEATSGASATSVVITFASAKTNAPFCTVTPQTALATFSYTISTTAISITQTATSAEKIDYVCIQH